MGFTGFYRVWLGLTGFYWVLLVFCWDLPAFTVGYRPESGCCELLGGWWHDRRWSSVWENVRRGCGEERKITEKQEGGEEEEEEKEKEKEKE